MTPEQFERLMEVMNRIADNLLELNSTLEDAVDAISDYKQQD